MPPVFEQILLVLLNNLFNFFILVFSPWVSFGQEPEPSQATGMALVCCILGKSLRVVCHCFPPTCSY